MTDEKAIEIIRSDCYTFNVADISNSILINQALDRAISALEDRINRHNNFSNTGENL